MRISDEVINNFLNGIYQGLRYDGTVDRALWDKTWKELFGSFEKGYGKSLTSVKFNSPDWEYLQNLKYNTAVFSAFKQNEAIKNAWQLLFDEKGNKRPWKDFRDQAMGVSDTYNKRWLQTEYNQAHSSALQARRWRDFENNADLYPNLQYIAVMDKRTRPEHAKLHGTILPISDPFWSVYAPPNGWGCRCTLRNTDKAPTGQPKDVPTVPKAFRVNPGQEAKVFSDDHAYIRGSQDRAGELMAFVKSQIKDVAGIRRSFDDFNAFNAGVYTKAYFNGNNGGYSVYHQGHNFDKTAGKYEKTVMKNLALDGKNVIALNESGPGKHIDISVGIEKHEIKAVIAGTSSSIKNALWEAFTKKNAPSVILYWPTPYDGAVMKRAVDRLYGQAQLYSKRIGKIYYMTSDGTLHLYN